MRLYYSDASAFALSECYFFFFQAEDGIRDDLVTWSSDVCSSDLSRFTVQARKRPKVVLGQLSPGCYREPGACAQSGQDRRTGKLCINAFGERTKMSTMTATSARTGGMTKDERFVILASSLGTVFEWYDFYLYGSLASIIGAQFFSAYPPATRDIFALLAFAAGFLVRPFGAIVFGRVGDIVGRKYTFLVTILIMGLSTFIVGLLPNAATIGFAAPVILIALRLAQGLALGGEYGGAAT